jgi:hypothetical protein
VVCRIPFDEGEIDGNPVARIPQFAGGDGETVDAIVAPGRGEQGRPAAQMSADDLTQEGGGLRGQPLAARSRQPVNGEREGTRGPQVGWVTAAHQPQIGDIRITAAQLVKQYLAFRVGASRRREGQSQIDGGTPNAFGLGTEIHQVRGMQRQTTQAINHREQVGNFRLAEGRITGVAVRRETTLLQGTSEGGAQLPQ